LGGQNNLEVLNTDILR